MHSSSKKFAQFAKPTNRYWLRRFQGIFTNYRKPESRIIYLVYLVLGGAIFDAKCPRAITVTYWLAIVFITATGFLPSIPCLYRAVNANVPDLMYIIQSSTGFWLIPSISMQILVIYLCRKGLVRAMQLIEKDFDVNWTDLERSFVRKTIIYMNVNTLKWTLAYICTDMGDAIIFIILRYTAAIINNRKADDLGNYFYYIFSFVYLEKINSYAMYNTIICVQVIILVMYSTTFLSAQTMLINLIGSFHNAFVRLANDMTTEWKKLYEEVNVERIYSDKYYDNLSIDEMANAKKLISVRFRNRCVLFLQSYRKLLRGVHNIKKYLAITFPLNCATTTFFMISMVYSCLEDGVPLFFKFTQGTSLIAIFLYLFSCCYVGKIMDDVTDMIAFTIYDTPWYYLQKNERKMIQMFLCEVQQTHFEVSSFKIYRLSMTAFIRVVRFNYSMINLILRLRSK